ncbi:MAG: cysteine desulfurase NifS [Deltaproteobacteria bacterium CG11_big_fil_rev_8_21_14_0_20_47_16]|nr:MAG: cysteine desulfurase NifS [Deltaproteobacteria bacterium CG11_big_fil_rev_8_21_14_0_20_47_16]
MIYLDNNATTQPLPEVIQAMLPYLTERWGNPSSLYPFGNTLGQALDKSREQAAALIGANRPSEVTFTGGGTESNHMAIRGILRAYPQKRHLITSAVEHSSIINLCKQLEGDGIAVTYLPVDTHGQIELKDLEAAIRPDTALVSLMWANNETGIIFPIDKIAKCCEAKGVPFHTDAVQAVGKLPLDVSKLPINLLSIAAHKIHGPKGVGALYIRRGTKWLSPMTGTQEHGRRAGTENVAGIVGLGVATQLAGEYLKTGVTHTATLRDRLEQTLCQTIPGARIAGKPGPRVANTCNILIPQINGEACITALAQDYNVCISTGSACSAGNIAGSHVLTAMGVDVKTVSPLRISLSRTTTEAEIATFCDILPRLVLTDSARIS